MCITYIVTMEFCMKRGELSIYLCGMNLIVRLSSTLVYEWVYATRQKEYINVYIILSLRVLFDLLCINIIMTLMISLFFSSLLLHQLYKPIKVFIVL
jgi:hypothetical protein